MRWLANRMRGERGASAVLVAILIVPLIGAAALAVDVGAMYAERAQLQNAADAGALAAAQYCSQHADCATAADKSAAKSAAEGVTGGNVVDVTPSVGALTFDAVNQTVQVPVARDDMPHPLAAAIGMSASDISAAAKAKWLKTAGGSVVPFAVGACSIGTTSNTFIPLSTNTTRPCSGALPGGFGWLDDGTTQCAKDVTVPEFIDITQGLPAKCGLTSAGMAAIAANLGCNLSTPPMSSTSDPWSQLFYCIVGRTIYVPVFEAASKCPGNAAGHQYCITKFAAFAVVGTHLKATSGTQIDYCASGVTCHSPVGTNGHWGNGDVGFEGRFISYVTPDPSWFLTSTSKVVLVN